MDYSPSSPLSALQEEQESRKNQSQWYLAWCSFQRNRLAMFGLIGLLLLFFIALIGPFIAPYSPTQIDHNRLFTPPSTQHWFGTDDLGRDILSRVLIGSQYSLGGAFLVVMISMSGGVLIGVISGYYGGLIDTIIMRLIDVLLAFPTILLLLSIAAALGPSLTTGLIAVAFAAIPSYTRLVRGLVLSAKTREYVLTARVMGAKDGRIMFIHILPNIIGPVIVFATLGLGSAIMLTAGLSYLGLGAQPPSPEWGAMLNAGRSFLRDAWWISVFPGIGIFWAVLCVNLFGDGLRDALDPRLKTLR